MFGRPFNHVAEETEGRFGREYGFVLRLDFLENVGLNRAPKIRNYLRTEATMYIAMMIGAGPLIVIEAEKFAAPTSKPS